MKKEKISLPVTQGKGGCFEHITTTSSKNYRLSGH